MTQSAVQPSSRPGPAFNPQERHEDLASAKERRARTFLVRATFLAFVFSIPFDMVAIQAGTALAKVIGIAFFVACVLNHREPFAKPPKAFWYFVGYLGIWVLMAVPQVNIEPFRADVLLRFSTLFQLLAFALVATNLMKDHRLAMQAVFAFGAASVLIALLMAAQVSVVREVTPIGSRMTFGGQNFNHIAGVFGMSLCALLGLAYTTQEASRRRQIIAVPASAVLVVMTMATGSRGGVVATAAGLAILLVQGGNLWRWVRSAAVMVVALAWLAYSLAGSDITLGRFRMSVMKGDVSLRERIYPEQITMFSESPLVGFGPVNNARELGKRIKTEGRKPMDAHNLVLHLLTEVGLFGAVPFLIGLGYCLKAAWDNRLGALGVVPLAVLCAMLAANLFGNWVPRKPLWLAISLALAQAPAAARMRRKAPETPSAPATPVLPA